MSRDDCLSRRVVVACTFSLPIYTCVARPRHGPNAPPLHMFHHGIGQVSPLLGELERRARVHTDELGSLQSKCHAAYFNARKDLLVLRLTEQSRVLYPTRTELVELVRVSSYVVSSRMIVTNLI